MIEIQSLTKRYRKHQALENVNLAMETGMFGLLGPNGAGKTTLMRILATLLKPTSGEVTINGRSLQKQPDDIRKMIGYLPQHFQIHPQLSGVEFLDYVGVMKGIRDKTARKKEIDRLHEAVNLREAAGKKVKTYSGGMRQRLGIAQALMNDPDVLIVDEPTAGLDPEERVRFRNLLARFSAERTVILSTHIVADIESSCQHLAVLNHGKVAMAGDLDDLENYAEGKVWEAELTNEQFANVPTRQIVSTRRTKNGVTCRMIADTAPADNAERQRPTLEDGYLALIGGDSGA